MRIKGKVLACALSVVALIGFTASRVVARQASQFDILTGFGAKEGCSCAFAAEQSDEYCKAFAQTGAAPVQITIDRKAQTVEASLAGNTRIARFKAGEGCQTDPLP